MAQKSPAAAKHEQQSLYRLGAGATLFEARDPDPNAVDGGRVLGIRFDVCVEGKFSTPYYLFCVSNKRENLPRSWSANSEAVLAYANSLRIHRHTIPPCIDLSRLEDIYLPQPSGPVPGSTLAKPPPPQDLPGFVAGLRHELIAYHLRLSSISRLHDLLVVPPPPRRRRRRDGEGEERESTRGTDEPVFNHGDGDEEDDDHGDSNNEIDVGGAGYNENYITDLKPVDAAAREIRIEWRDGTTARVLLGRDGDIEKCIAHYGRARDSTGDGINNVALELAILGVDQRIEGLYDRLSSFRQF